MTREMSPLGRALGPTYPIDARILRDIQPFAGSADLTRSTLIMQTLQTNKTHETRDEKTR